MGNYTKRFERTQRLKNANLYGRMTLDALLKYIDQNFAGENKKHHTAVAERNCRGRSNQDIFAYFKITYGQEAVVNSDWTPNT